MPLAPPRRRAPSPTDPARQRNDVGQYDDLAGDWWDPEGPLAMLHWLAEARAGLVPRAARPGAVLVDLGCGAGLLAPWVSEHGYRHVGVDLTRSALVLAATHRVLVVQGDVACVALPDGVADVVCAGEILEHVDDLDAAVDEACRLLRPGGTLVIDTVAATAAARLLAVEAPDRLPIDVPKGLHAPELLVDRDRLVAAARRSGVALSLRGLRPSVTDLARFLAGRRGSVRMVPTWTTAVLFQAWGTKQAGG